MIIETDKYIVRELESGLLENFIKEGAHIVAEDVRLLKKANMQISTRDKYVVLVNSSQFNSISKEARELSASKEFSNETIAKALMTPSTGHKLIVQFYLRVNKPHIITKPFTDKNLAINWLKTYL